MCRLSLIIRVNVVLNRTVVVDSDYVQTDQTQRTFEMTFGFKPFTIMCVSLSNGHTLPSIPQISNPKCIGSHIV